jgi:formamidopyrimidine-DNA glycosylase
VLAKLEAPEAASRLPELPEVETLRSDCERLLLGHRVVETSVLVPSIIRFPSSEEFRARLTEAQFAAARRRAKYLLLDLDNGDTLALQLAVFGQLLLQSASEPREPETLLSFRLDDDRILSLLDRSRYTRVALAATPDLTLKLKLDELGPEPCSTELTPQLLIERLGGSRARLKALLLDQHYVAGLGNIYVDEALWRACLHPARAAISLTDAEWLALYGAIRDVVQEAIANRGTTFHTYRDLSGAKGHHQEALAVFHRQGKPCRRCGATIVRTRLGGRDTHLCPACQLAPP